MERTLQRSCSICVTLAFALWWLTCNVKNPAQFLREFEYFVRVFFVSDLFGETFYALVVRKVHETVHLTTSQSTAFADEDERLNARNAMCLTY